jgi:hypothetical protein
MSKVREDRLEKLALLVEKEKRDLQVQLDFQEKLVNKDLLDHKVLKDLQEKWDHLACKEGLVTKDLSDSLGMQDQQVISFYEF